MSAILNDAMVIVGDTWEAVSDAAADVWEEAVLPKIEDVFGLFGIVDEDVIITQRISSLIFGDNDEDVIQKANTKSVIAMTREGGDFFQWYMHYSRLTQNQIKGFYNFVEFGRHVDDLPTLRIVGNDVDFVAIDAAVTSHLGANAVRLTYDARYPTTLEHMSYELQATPYYFRPWENKLTFTDPYGVSRTDYTLDTINYIAGTDSYEILISRNAKEALFWIEGPVHVVNGDSITYTIRCNRTVPVGKSVSVDITYTGTASNGTPVSTVVIPAGFNQTTVTISAAVVGTMIATLTSINNVSAAFEAVNIDVRNVISTGVTTDAGIVLTMPSVRVSEASGSATVPVTLENAASGAFTVDYVLIDGTATGLLDYDNTGGTLNFAGTTGEVQNITIPIYTDAPDDNETFTVLFTACSDPSVIYSQTSVVTITDDSADVPIQKYITLPGVITKPGHVYSKSMIIKYNTTISPNWYYWIYKFSDNTYPDVNESSTSITNLKMLPIAILKRNRININSDKTTAEYKSTKRLLDSLGMDMDEVTTNTDANPDSDLISDLFVNFSVSPKSTDVVVSKILWETFHNMIVDNGLVSNTGKYQATFEGSGVQNAIAWTDHRYSPIMVGNMLKDYDHEIVTVAPVNSPVYPGSDEVQETIPGYIQLVLKRKLGAIFHESITLNSMSGLASISYGGNSWMGFNTLEHDNFTIPISYHIYDQLTPNEREQAYQHLFRIDAYASDVVHLEFYKTSGFSNLFDFISVIIIIWTLGTATAPIVALRALLVNYLIMQIVIYLAELTGNAEFAAIIGLVAMIALSGGSGSGQMFDFTSAEGLINASTEFANNLTLGYDTLTEGLKEDLDDLNKQAEARLAEIDDATIEESPVTSEFLVMLNSVDTTVFPAVKAQYDFNLLYNYDRLIADYHKINLTTGVI